MSLILLFSLKRTCDIQISKVMNIATGHEVASSEWIKFILQFYWQFTTTTTSHVQHRLTGGNFFDHPRNLQWSICPQLSLWIDKTYVFIYKSGHEVSHTQWNPPGTCSSSFCKAAATQRIYSGKSLNGPSPPARALRAIKSFANGTIETPRNYVFNVSRVESGSTQI
jgi:hypothetical protein